MRALVLSGGGAKGAFQAGALQYLLRDKSVHYDILCGISVGSLNASYLAMFGRGEEAESVEGLIALWHRVDRSFVYKQRYPYLGKYLSMIISAFTGKSLYDSTPLLDTIDSTLNIDRMRSSGKKLRIGAVSVETGDYRIWTEEDDDIKLSVGASSAFPGFLNPVYIDSQFWTDGGVRNIAPIEEALRLGATSVDVVLTSPRGLHRLESENLTVVGAAPRIIDIMSEEIIENDVELSRCRAGKSLPIRVLRPPKVLLVNSLDFSPEKIRQNIDIGYKTAKEADWY